jgi:hypothetical protein
MSWSKFKKMVYKAMADVHAPAYSKRTLPRHTFKKVKRA